MEKTEIVVTETVAGLRLDKAISLLSHDISRNSIQKSIEDGEVFLNNGLANKKDIVKLNDVIKFQKPEKNELAVFSQNIPIEIVYEDDYLLVVNKPKGMVVHPAVGNLEGTLVNALMYHCGNNLSRINGEFRPGIVHRLDKDTSGLLVVAKNDAVHINLADQIKNHKFTKIYNAVVVGNIKDDFGTIDAPIGRNPKNRQKQAVTTINSKNAVTHFEVLKRFNGFTFIKVRLETGRTHQIRVHMAYRGNPVAGDVVYGNPKKTYGLDGQCLNATTLGFTHPVTNNYVEFSCELPDYFKDFLGRIS